MNGWYLSRSWVAIDLFLVVATSISDHRDVGLEVVVLSEADDIEAIYYAGHVITVFDNGFYELELLAKVDFLDSGDRSYLNIEPRQLIVKLLAQNAKVVVKKMFR